MCGIIGLQGDNSPENRELVRKLLKESLIRGRHSIGAAIWVSGSIVSSHSTDVDTWINTGLDGLFDKASSEAELVIIGIARYSTSDINAHQPLVHDNKAFVMNGVITQDVDWNKDGKYPSNNDAEILFDNICNGVLSTSGSWAAIKLEDGRISWIRNSDRPLYSKCCDYNTSILASTNDIIKRAVGADGYLVDSCDETDIQTKYIDYRRLAVCL